MCDATRSTERDFCRLQHIVHHFRFLGLAASTSKLTCRYFSFFWPIRSCPALISCFSSTYTAMPVAESVNFPADKKPFCRGRLLHVDGDATCCGLRLEITSLLIRLSLNYTLRILTPETWRSRRRPAPCLFPHHRRKQSSGAQGEGARDSGLELVTRTYVANRPTHRRGLVLWQRRSSVSEATGTTSYCSLLLKSRGRHTGFACKKFSAKKKKTDRPPVKIWAMLVEAETFFCLALEWFTDVIMDRDHIGTSFEFPVKKIFCIFA